MNTPPTALIWYLASDGTTPAVDMSVALVSAPIYSPALKCSFQFWWTATGSPRGVFGFQESSDSSHWDTASLATSDQTPTQPAGTADSSTINVTEFLPAYIRATYTPTSGGTGAVLAGKYTIK